MIPPSQPSKRPVERHDGDGWRVQGWYGGLFPVVLGNGSPVVGQVGCEVLFFYKSPGLDGIYPLLLQRTDEEIMWLPVRLIRAKPSYDSPKDFGPINLTSFYETLRWWSIRFIGINMHIGWEGPLKRFFRRPSQW